MGSYMEVAHNGTVLSWRAKGIEVLATLQQNQADASRGGLPLCVPMFSTQQRAVTGSALPLHGLLMYEAAEPVEKIVAGESWHRTHHFKAGEAFAWDWSVELAVKLTDHSLRYTLAVERSANCSNEQEMPLSLGFHPYFNTFHQDFSFTIDEKTYAKNSLPDNIIDSDFAPLRNGEAAVLRTAAYTLTLTPSGYDEYCLWSDNVDTYFCIEPIYQYREFGQPGTGLQPGQSHETSVALQLT